MTSKNTPTTFTSRSLGARRWGVFFGVLAQLVLIFVVFSVAFHLSAPPGLFGVAAVIISAGLSVFLIFAEFAAGALEETPCLLGGYFAPQPSFLFFFPRFSISFFRPPRIPAA